MLLLVGLLVSIADFFDIGLGEVAWLIFLVPLLAIYWLILLSTRLNEQTRALGHSLQRQEELRHYASNITRVQEDERRRLARELHDDTAQALIALARGLDGLKKRVVQQELPWVTQLQELADQTVKEEGEGARREDVLALRYHLPALPSNQSDDTAAICPASLQPQGQRRCL